MVAPTGLQRTESFQRVPVDRCDVPPSFRAATESVFDFVEQASEEYLRLQDERDNAARLTCTYASRSANTSPFHCCLQLCMLSRECRRIFSSDVNL